MSSLELPPWEMLSRLRREQPLVHHLTNWVTIYDCAQVVKVLGGSPVMAHAQQEVMQMTRLAAALVLNIGTLTPDFVSAMIMAAQAANAQGIPVVLDVCGAGATRLRDESSQRLLDEAHIDLIKGNASEIARVSGLAIQTKGVDATAVQADLKQVARGLARQRQAVVVITGASDIVADEARLVLVHNGHPLMGHVVGTGCMATSIIGAFAAVEPDLTVAAAGALACFGVAAELAAQQAAGPGSFKERLFDALYNLDEATLRQRLRVEAMS
ncbi:MAG: hydroxyethylthiazole kinase [Desulfobacca sp.]|uniref:hydroxyethylthiazole kinase n=1 Tax=Desulfobacca sp. TaxID=2067990 RepID=UPI004049E2EC